MPNAHGELLKPTPEKRLAVGLQFAELDEGKWLDEGALNDAGKALVERGFRELAANPHASVP